MFAAESKKDPFTRNTLSTMNTLLKVCPIPIFFSFSVYLAGQTKTAEDHLHEGRALQVSGRWQPAFNSYSDAVTMNPRSAEALFNRAVCAINLEKPNVALLDLNDLLRLSPNDVVALDLRGTLLLEKGAYQKSIDDFTKVIESEKSFNAHLNRAIAYLQLNQLGDCFEDLTVCKTLETNHPALNAAFGDYFLQKGDEAMAMSCYEKSLALAANNASVLNNCGSIAANKEDFAKAIDYFNQALAVAEESRTYANLALTQVKLKDYEGASAHAIKALELDLSEPSANFAQAVISFDNGNYQETVDYCTEALRHDENYAAAYLLRAKAQLNLDERLSAKADLEKAVQLQPSNLEAAELLKMN